MSREFRVQKNRRIPAVFSCVLDQCLKTSGAPKNSFRRETKKAVIVVSAVNVIQHLIWSRIKSVTVFRELYS